LNKNIFSNKINDFRQQIEDLQNKLDTKTHEAELLENELNQLKEFRKKKIQMQRELEEVHGFENNFNFLSREINFKMN
jgi:predicted RNase H-like nuclease (RuvC/YqgF family)